MANHGYILMENPIDPKSLDFELKRIMKKRFPRILKHIDFSSNVKGGWGQAGTWSITFDEKEKYAGILLWITDADDLQYTREHFKEDVTGRQLEFRHGHGRQPFWYIESVFQQELSTKFSGIMWDDACGYEEMWEPKLKEYKDYKTYAMQRWPPKGMTKEEKKEQIKYQLEIDKNTDSRLKPLFECLRAEIEELVCPFDEYFYYKGKEE